MSVHSKMTAIADAIRLKTGTSEPLTLDGMAEAIANLEQGSSSGGASVTKKDVNFYDYDGTLLHSYTVAEAQALNELPALPEQSGLVCQGWNWSLEDIKAHNRAVDVGAMYITDDGTTRIYITLQEGRTSPVLGVCPNGTVTVDWGDGTEPDVLTGTSVSTVKYTPNHEYAAPGDYVIRLTVDGEIGFRGGYGTYSYVLKHASSTSNIDYAYISAIQKIQLGYGVKNIGDYAFLHCWELTSITIPNDVTNIGEYAFSKCSSLTSITIPNRVPSISAYIIQGCSMITAIAIPNGVTSIGQSAVGGCYALASATIPNSVTSIGSSAFNGCKFRYVTIPNSVTSIGSSAFNTCYHLRSLTIPNSVTSIGSSAFSSCYVLRSVTIPAGVTSIAANTFGGWYSAIFFDFSSHTAVPTLANTNAFSNIPADFEIRVPAALYDEWIAATNWSSLASKIVAV